MDIEELILLREHSQLLVMNSWRHEIPHEQRNIIIANALNQCTNDKGFDVLGYLITQRRIFLIGSSEITPFQEILQYFYYQVSTGIAVYLKDHHQYDNAHHLAHHSDHQLFTKYPFYNDHLRSLITGKQVELPYYDPNLARLKAYIHSQNYCSALDYAGGKSPVIVATDEIIL